MARYTVQHKNKGCSWFTEQHTINEEFAFNAAERLIESGNYNEVRVLENGQVVFLEEVC